MRKWLGLFALSVLLLEGCGNSKDAITVYILCPPNKADRFTKDLGTVVEQHGLKPNLGQSTDDNGHTLYVIEADSILLHLWGQNMPLSGREDPDQCGPNAEARPDPGQYIVTIDHGLVKVGLNHLLALITNDGPRELASEVTRGLQASGYDVRTKPVLCSPLLKRYVGQKPN